MFFRTQGKCTLQKIQKYYNRVAIMPIYLPNFGLKNVLFQSSKPILKQQNPDCFKEGF